MIEHVEAADAPAPGGAYSQGTFVSGWLFTAGMGPVDPASGTVVGSTIEVQTRQVLANLRAVLIAAGLDLADVVKVTVHLAHLERDFATFNSVYASIFAAPYPARTTVGSALLGVLVEVDCVARGRTR